MLGKDELAGRIGRVVAQQRRGEKDGQRQQAQRQQVEFQIAVFEHGRVRDGEDSSLAAPAAACCGASVPGGFLVSRPKYRAGRTGNELGLGRPAVCPTASARTTVVLVRTGKGAAGGASDTPEERSTERL